MLSVSNCFIRKCIYILTSFKILHGCYIRGLYKSVIVELRVVAFENNHSNMLCDCILENLTYSHILHASYICTYIGKNSMYVGTWNLVVYREVCSYLLSLIKVSDDLKFRPEFMWEKVRSYHVRSL